MDRLLNVTAGISVGLIVLVLISVRRAHIRPEYSVAWLTAGVVMLLLSLDEAVVRWLAAIMGIDDPPLALFAAVLLIFLIVFYRSSRRISDLKDANIALAQRVAILEYRLQVTEEAQAKPQ